MVKATSQKEMRLPKDSGGRGKKTLQKVELSVVGGFQKRIFSGLGTAFFYVLNASFFCILLKHATFFCVLFRVIGDL